VVLFRKVEERQSAFKLSMGKESFLAGC